MAIDLLVTDRYLDVLGDPITGWTKLSVDLNFNAPASGEITVPAYPDVMQLLQPGNRLVIIRDGAIWCAGPLEEPQNYTWDLEQNAGGTVTARFSDDLARVAGYLTYPEPGEVFEDQTTTSNVLRTFTTVRSESVIRALVNENCGPGALAGRRIEGLVLDAVANVGTDVTFQTRFEPLLDACRILAAGGGALGFRTRQVGSQIRFGVYAPVDRTGTARFSAGLGNLRSVSFTLGAPTATSELVQGGDDPAQEATPPNEREYVEVTADDAVTQWYRVEKLLEKSGTHSGGGALILAGVAALTEDGPQASLSTVTVDTEDLRAGRDYGLGDRVTVVLPTGREVVDTVQAVRLEATPTGGEVVTCVIGGGDKETTSATERTLREVLRLARAWGVR
ncbi:siphovirus ReqiPepy6 Gp37-like family protein [Streptomyces sp. NPDC059477]|uniref:siphovirus ReqiPepy6 Gp37-like family protein n=1 Tax=Streptomyces sp. NPDC059477 TaxID=3346847 RepID=UPI0036C888EA